MFFRYSAFLYLIIFFICSVSPVCPFLPLLFPSGLRSENGLFFPLSHPCCFDLLFTHCVTNVTHSLGLGLRVFCPVRPVSLPFSPGSVPTLFYSTIYLHFNIFKKKSDEAPTISVSEAAFFPWNGRTNTLHGFLSYVVSNSMLANSSRAYKYHHGKIKLLFPAVQYQNTLFTSIYIYIYIYFFFFFFFHGHGSDRMFL